ncbi:MAG: methyltransferase domain-containing protein [Elusimicrobia bacterium]|nr:methyltransferase domain-containing protein [Elusimicrobiota bacterium]
MKENSVRLMVKRAYGRAAKKANSCCGNAVCCGHKSSGKLYGELGLSCGDPVSFSKIKKGMRVLDLGCGAGKDVFLAAKLVGPKGFVIGVDMTDEMIALARKNLRAFSKAAGYRNIEFRKGIIEKLPLPDYNVDLIISNCVINLSPDKPAVFSEAFRTLKSGGKIAVSDIVLNRKMPSKLKKQAGLYAACISGAMLRNEYISAIKNAGFASIKILSDKLYSADTSRFDPITSKTGGSLKGIASSITVEAVKP